MAHDWRPCTWRVNADLEAWKLLGQVFDMVRSMDVNIFFLCCLLYFPVLRHLEPAVQLLFVSQLAWQLAKQLDCERGCCQPPVFGGGVPLSDSQWEISWPREVEVLVFTFSRVENARCSMPGAIFEKAWNSGNLGIFRWYVTWLIMIHDCVSLSNQWYMICAFICGPLRAHVGEIDNAITVHYRTIFSFRNCSTFWSSLPPLSTSSPDPAVGSQSGPFASGFGRTTGAESCWGVRRSQQAFDNDVGNETGAGTGSDDGLRGWCRGADIGLSGLSTFCWQSSYRRKNRQCVKGCSVKRRFCVKGTWCDMMWYDFP